MTQKTYRFALGLEYSGSHYYGWQYQLHVQSIQRCLEEAVSRVADHPVTTVVAGRTDKGVHALGQVVHFETTSVRETFSWVRGCNRYLPQDIQVCWAREVPPSFDARRSALARRYCYVILRRSVRSPILRQATAWIFCPLDIKAMREAASYLQGTHDFSAFRDSECQAKNPVRIIEAIEWVERGAYWILDVTANAFLHHMVRNIVGTLLWIGQGKYPPFWIKNLLAAKERRLAGKTADPEGLYLVSVRYPSEYGIPCHPEPWFF